MYGDDSEPEEEYAGRDGDQHTDPDETVDEEPDFAAMTPEQLVLYKLFDHHYEDSSELDDYQLDVLLKLESGDAT